MQLHYTPLLNTAALIYDCGVSSNQQASTSISDSLFRKHLHNLNPNLGGLAPDDFLMTERRTTYRHSSARALYSRADFYDALAQRRHSKESITLQMKEWIQLRGGLAVVQASAGLGKTTAGVELFRHYQPTEHRLVYCADTSKNRDAFAALLDPAAVFVVPSNAELISRHYPEHSKKVRSAIEKLYSDKGYTRRSMKELIASMNFLNDAQRNAAIEAEHVEISNQLLNRTKHLIMTSAKFKALREFSRNGWVLDKAHVFIDEPGVFELSAPPVGQTYRVYGKEHAIEERGTFSPDFEQLREMSLCYLSTEPNVGLEIKKLGLRLMEIGAPEKCFDAGLTVAIVESTSGMRGRDADIVQTIKRHWDGPFIANRFEDETVENHVSVKGSNDYIGVDTVTMLTMPPPALIAEAMACYGLVEDDAIALILTNQFNQSVCRSVGLRNVSGQTKCLAIVSEKMVAYLKPLVVTTNVFSKGGYKRARNPQNPFTALLDDLYDWTPTTSLAMVSDKMKDAFLTELGFRLTAGGGVMDLKAMEADWANEMHLRTMIKLVEDAGFAVTEKQVRFGNERVRQYLVSRVLH